MDHREQIEHYLDVGGKAFINLEPVLVDMQQLAGLTNKHSFADFVESYFGVIIDDNMVYDLRSNETLSFSTGSTANVLLPYPYWVRAKIVDKKVGGNVNTVVMPWSSSLGIMTLPDNRYKIQPLIASTEFAAIDDSYRNLRPDSPVFSDPLQTNFFSSDLGITAESTNGSRVVIIGDADWLADTATQRFSTNILLGLNLIDWLAQEDSLASVRSKVVSERKLVFSSNTHRDIVQYSNIGGIPLAFILLGFIRYLSRRSKGFRNNWRHKAGRLIRKSPRPVDSNGESSE